MRAVSLLLLLTATAHGDLRNSSPPFPAKQHMVVILSFDDGPDSRQKNNRTETVLQFLREPKVRGVPGSIVGIFFVQTHATYRGGHERGQSIIKKAHDQGHVIGIHTGSEKDHVAHTKRLRKKITGPDGARRSLLSQDLAQAILRLKALTGERPKYVRPPYRRFNEAVEQAYESAALAMVLWDIDSRDTRTAPDNIKNVVRKYLTIRIRQRREVAVILLHDILKQTSDPKLLAEVVETIVDTGKEQGVAISFPTNRQQVHEALRRRKLQKDRILAAQTK